MDLKEELVSLLEESGEAYVSGSEIGNKIGITRSGVWKIIKCLQEDGYDIEAVPNRGYRLSPDNDMISEAGIRKYLGSYNDIFQLDVREKVTSTNTLLKARADSLPTWSAMVAMSQTAGRGRTGHTFYSPSQSGVYISLLLRPDVPAEESVRITTAAAVAECKAIETCCGSSPAIKWINDVFLNGKKICGILTEASLNMETRALDWAVLGIGMNVYEPENGFPEEIREIAGPIETKKTGNLRNRLTAEFLKNMYDLCRDLRNTGYVEEYRKRSFLIGQRIAVLRPGHPVPATAVDVDDECRLLVRYDDGSEESLSSGEVSVRKISEAKT